MKHQFMCVECQSFPASIDATDPPSNCPDCGASTRETLRNFGQLTRHAGRSLCGELEFPSMPAVVYYCIDKRDIELYIGFSTNLVVRLAQHALRSPWWGEVAKVTWVDFGTTAEARAFESKEIRLLNPIGNIAGREPEGGTYTPPAGAP